MADIKKINVNGTLYDVNLDSTKDVDIKSLKVNDGNIVVGTGDYESMTTASETVIADNSIIMHSKIDNEVVAYVEIGAHSDGSYMSTSRINSNDIVATNMIAENTMMVGGTVTSGTIIVNKTVQAANVEVESALTVGSQTITNLNGLLQNVSQTRTGDSTFLTVFTNPSDLTHKLQVSSAYIEQLATDEISSGSIVGVDAAIGTLTADDVNTSAITLGGVRKTAWPEGGGSDYTYITENTNNKTITVGSGYTVGTTGTVGTIASTVNLKAAGDIGISATRINLTDTNGVNLTTTKGFNLSSPSLGNNNIAVTIDNGNIIGTLNAKGLAAYDRKLGKFINAGVLSTDDGAVNHSFTGSIVASKIVTLSDSNTGLQISDNDIKYNGVLSGTVLKVYKNYSRDNSMFVGLGDTFVGSLVAKGLYLRRGNLDFIDVITLDGNDSNHKTAYIGSTQPSFAIDDFKFCGTLLNSAGNSSPRIYYTNSQSTSSVDNMKAALDELYNRVAALEQN